MAAMPQEAIQQGSTQPETTKPDKYSISTAEALREGYSVPEPVPEAVSCKYCGRKLEYYGLVSPVAPRHVIVWKSRPERCTCSKAQDFWKDWDAKEEARKAAEAEQKAREEEMQRFRSMMERSGMKARFQNRRFENFVQDTQGRRQAYTQAKKYADNFQRMRPVKNDRNHVTPPEIERNGLFMAGGYGTGKTHLAAAIANQLTITEEQMLYDLGIPIGGGLSHMLGNMYLDPLDQFCKRVLGIKRYIRYMDDIIILDNDKERLKEYGRRMTQFLEERLHLNFNNKTALRPVRVGCEFVGFVIYNDHVILRKSTTLRMKRTLRKTRQDYHDNLITFKEANATMQSYLAMLSHVDCKKFKEKLLDEFVLTHADDNGEEQIINVIETGGIGALDYETMYC